MTMFTIYTIYNKDHDKIYIGQTWNLSERLNQHDNKIFTNSYTSRFSGEWQLIYQEYVFDRSDALKREKQLKSYRGREFIKKYIPR